MGAGSVWTGDVTDIGRRGAYGETVEGERVLDAQRQAERISRPVGELVLHHRAVRLPFADSPALRPNEAVDRVLPLGFGQVELMALAVELVASVLQPVRPRDQDLTAAGATRLVGAVTVEDVDAVNGVLAQTAADLDDHRTLSTQCQLDLFAGWSRYVSSAWYCASSRSSSLFLGNRKKTSVAPSRIATIPAV